MLAGGKAQFTINKLMKDLRMFFPLIWMKIILIGGNIFKSVFKNSARAPLATVSWLQAAVRTRKVSMMELQPPTVTVSMVEVEFRGGEKSVRFRGYSCLMGGRFRVSRALW